MKLRRISAILTAMLALLAMCGMTAFARTEGVEVYVTITDGQIRMAHQSVVVTDVDADGVLTISDALYAAHEAAYEGGAAAGYSCDATDYGLSMTRLWGVENGGSYGYCLNNASAMSLADPISEGDYIAAYAYTDLSAWSDTYCFFDIASADVNAGDTVSLTLTAAGYDESWNPITLPVEGAKITVNGQDSGVVTDAEGKAVVTVTAGGENVISAVSDTQNLVPPVCVAVVAASQSADDALSAGVPAYIWISAAVVFVAAGVIGFTAGFRKHK